MVNECREIGHVFLNVALSSGSLALTVPPAIVGHHAEGACEPWDNGIPVVMVAPRTVDEDDEIPRPSAKVPKQPNAVDARDRHSVSSPPAIRRGLTTLVGRQVRA